MSFGPLAGHPFQVGTYALTTGAEKGVILYENKDTQDYKEFVFTRDELPLKEIEEVTESVWTHIGDKKLFDVLPECEMKEGYRYNGCPFRKQCLKIQTWEQAEEIAA